MCGYFGAELLDPDANWNAFEKALDRSGTPIALPSRLAWTELMVRGRGRLVAVRGEGGEPAFATSVLSSPSWIVPGHEIWRLERLGVKAPAEAVACAIRTIAAEARRYGRVLRVELSVVTPDPDRSRAIAEAAAGEGFCPRIPPDRIYEHTAMMDLTTGDAGALFSTLQKKTRRDIRLPARRGLEFRIIDDPNFAPRLEVISRETTMRTGGIYNPINWRRVIELSRRYPDRSRLVGTFVVNRNSSDALLAFAWGCHHGEYAHYEAGGSLRPPGINTPLSYVLLWDLIYWAQVNKASWFDLGGISSGDHATDRLAGISEMKHYFSRVEARVGEEWVYNPFPQRARFATMVGNLVRRVRGLMKKPPFPQHRHNCLSG